MDPRAKNISPTSNQQKKQVNNKIANDNNKKEGEQKPIYQERVPQHGDEEVPRGGKMAKVKDLMIINHTYDNQISSFYNLC